MFGHRRAGTHHDLPSALAAFAQRTSGSYGTASGIARDRTLLRFYRPFLSAPEVRAAVETMAGPSVAHLKFGLGLLTSRFRANHPLKACLNCMQSDIAGGGWAYWHLEHQFPGVWVCPLHDEQLLASTVKSTGVERFLWHLPTKDCLADAAGDVNASSQDALNRLARVTIALIDRNEVDGELSAPAVQATLRRRLVECGWMTTAGNVRLRAAAGAFLEHCKPLRAIAELAGLPADVEAAQSQLGRLVRPLRSGTHPLRLLVAVGWLFEDAADFMVLHRSQQQEGGGGVNASAARPSGSASDLRKCNLLDRLAAGESVTAAARAIGVDVSTAMAWAAVVGVAVGRRPKTLTADVRTQLLADLSRGMAKDAAAGRYGVSVQTVTRVLRTEVGLHGEWKTARAERAKHEARSTWLELMSELGSLGAKLMRASCPAAYAWLYRNDRSWLREHMPSRSASAGVGRAGSVRWDRRDEALSLMVRQAVVRLVEAHGHRTLYC